MLSPQLHMIQENLDSPETYTDLGYVTSQVGIKCHELILLKTLLQPLTRITRLPYNK